jgi:hypothetical protein
MPQRAMQQELSGCIVNAECESESWGGPPNAVFYCIQTQFIFDTSSEVTPRRSRICRFLPAVDQRYLDLPSALNADLASGPRGPYPGRSTMRTRVPTIRFSAARCTSSTGPMYPNASASSRQESISRAEPSAM